MPRKTLNYISFSSIIIRKQPPPVLEVGTPFETEVGLLANIPSLSPVLRIRVLSAADAESLVSGAASCEEM